MPRAGGGYDNSGFAPQGNPLGDEDTARRVKVLTQYIGGGQLSPGDAYGIASDPSFTDEQLIRTVAPAIHFAKAVKTARRFKDMTRIDAVSGHGTKMQDEWERMDPLHQAFLRDMGVKAPAERFQRLNVNQDTNEDDGFGFDDLVSAPFDALGWAAGEVKENVWDPAWKGATWAFGLPSHVYRFSRYGEEASSGKERGLFELSTDPDAGGIGWMFDLDKVTTAWAETGRGDGEKSYLPHTKHDAFEIAGNHQRYSIAEELAMPDAGENTAAAAQKWASKKTGIPLESPVATNDAKFQKAFRTFLDAANDPRTKEAADLLRKSKMSPGRDVARAVGLHEGTAYNLVSGGADLAWQLGADPTLLGGKLLATTKAARYGIFDNAQLVERIAQFSDDTLDLRAGARAITDIAHPDYMKALNAVAGPNGKNRISEFERILVIASDMFGTAGRDPEKISAGIRLMGPQGIRMLPALEEADRLRRAAHAPGNLGLVEKLALGQGENAVRAKFVSKLPETAESQSAGIAAMVNDAEYWLTGVMKGEGFAKPSHVLDYFKSDLGAEAIMRGQWSQHGQAFTKLPSLSKAGTVRLRAKLAVEEGIWSLDEWSDRSAAAFAKLAEQPVENLTLMQRIALSGEKVEKPLVKFLSGWGSMAKSMTSQLPRTADALTLDGTQSLAEIDRWLRIGLNRDEYKMHLGTIFAAESVPAKRAAVRSAMDDMFHRLGIWEHSPDKAEEWLRGMTGPLEKNYSPDRMIGSVLDGDLRRAAAVYPIQTADNMVGMPNFRELMKASYRQSVMRKVRDGPSRLAINGSMLDTAVGKVWKPAMVMRLAFIPRAILDESIPWIFREGLKAPVKQWGIMPFLAETDAARPVAWWLRPLAAMERRVKNAEYADEWVKGWRRYEGAVAGEELGTELPKLSKKGQSVLREQLTAISGRGDLNDHEKLAVLLDELGVGTAMDPKQVTRKMRAMIGYRDEDASLVKMVHHGINRVLTRAGDTYLGRRFIGLSGDELRAYQKLLNNPGIVRPHLEGIAGPDAMFMDTDAIRDASPKIRLHQQNAGGSRTKIIEMRVKPHGEKIFEAVPGGKMQDMAWSNAVEHSYGSLARDPIFRAIAGNAYVDPDDAFGLLARMDPDGSTLWAEDPYRFIMEARKDFTAVGPKVQQRLEDLRRATSPEHAEGVLVKLREQFGLEPGEPFDETTALGHVLNDWVFSENKALNNDRSILFHRMDQHYDDVGGMHPPTIDDGVPAADAGILSRDEFTHRYLSIHGRMQDAIEKGDGAAEFEYLDQLAKYENHPAADRAAAALDGGRNDPFFPHALYNELAIPEGRLTREAGDPIDDLLAAPDRLATPIKDEAWWARDELIQRALSDPDAAKELVRQRALAGLRDPRHSEQVARMDASEVIAATGRPAMKPVPKDHRRYYTILMEDRHAKKAAEALQALPNDEEGMGGVLEGYKQLRVGANPTEVGAIPTMPESGDYVAFSAWATLDPVEARRVADDVAKRAGLEPNQWTLGYTDIGDGMTTSRHKLAKNLGMNSAEVYLPRWYLNGGEWTFGRDADALRQMYEPPELFHWFKPASTPSPGQTGGMFHATNAEDWKHMGGPDGELQVDGLDPNANMLHLDADSAKPTQGGGKATLDHLLPPEATDDLENEIAPYEMLWQDRHSNDMEYEDWVDEDAMSADELLAYQTELRDRHNMQDPDVTRIVGKWAKQHQIPLTNKELDVAVGAMGEAGLYRTWDVLAAAAARGRGYDGIFVHSAGTAATDEVIALTDNALVSKTGYVPQDVGATREEIENAMVERAMADGELRFSGGGAGKFNHVPASSVHNGTYSPADTWLSEADRLPNKVVGPELYIASENVWDSLVRNAFDKVLSPPISAILRSPMYMDKAAKAHVVIENVMRPRLTNALHDDAGAALAHYLDMENADQVYNAMDALFTRIHGFRDISGQLGKRLNGILGEIASGKKLELNDDLFGFAREAGLLDDMPELNKLGGKPLQEANSWFRKERDTQEKIVSMASERAFNDVVPFIDDHRIRAQAADQLRNLVPFYFAEELFLKRLARTVAFDPTSLHKLQLITYGLNASGISHKDEYGEDVFTYPGSAFTQGMLNRVTSLMGVDANLPVSIPLTGQVKYSSPGFASIGVPSFTPLFSVPLTYMANIFPELNPAEESFLGERGADRGLIEALVPAPILRTYHNMVDDAENSSKFANIQFGVMQLMESNAIHYDVAIDKAEAELLDARPDERAVLEEKIKNLHQRRDEMGVPGANAGPNEVARWIERTKSWTRNMMILQNFVGFTGPASPQVEFPNEISAEFRSLLQTLPVDEATRELMKKHPDATPYTIFGSKTESGASLSTTEQGFKWVNENEQFISKNSLAGPWLMPRPLASEGYSRDAYEQQLSQHMRTKMGMADAWKEMKFAEAAPLYFETRDNFQIQRDAAETPEERRLLDATWGTWRTTYAAQNPVFDLQLRSPDAKIRRERTIEELRNARYQENAPAEAFDPRLDRLLQQWDTYKTTMGVLKYERGQAGIDRREKAKTDFFNWGTTFAENNADYNAMWLRVFRPEIGLDSFEIDQLVGTTRGMAGTLKEPQSRFQNRPFLKTQAEEANAYSGPSRSYR